MGVLGKLDALQSNWLAVALDLFAEAGSNTVKQQKKMFTAIKVREFYISDMYKAIIIYGFLFPTCILIWKE